MNDLINIHTFVIKLTLRFRYRSCFLPLNHWLYLNLIAKRLSFICQGSLVRAFFSVSLFFFFFFFFCFFFFFSKSTGSLYVVYGPSGGRLGGNENLI